MLEIWPAGTSVTDGVADRAADGVANGVGVDVERKKYKVGWDS